MIIERNECYDCAASGYPCVGDTCPYIHVQYYACDICGKDETEIDIYQFDESKTLCIDCILKKLNKVSMADK